MRVIVIAIIFLCSCSSKKEHLGLVTGDLTFFERYAPECERFMELGKKCKGVRCFNAAALEIVGVDTAVADTHSVYAWCWMQQFKMVGNVPSGTKGAFTPVQFKVHVSGRSYSVAEVYLPDAEAPLKEQLTEREFPKVLVKKYFTNQGKDVEMERVKVLSEKAKDKYRMFLEKAYVPKVDKVK